MSETENSVSLAEPSVADTFIAERPSPIVRAHAVLARAFIEPADADTLIREIAREIADAEMAMLRAAEAMIRESFGRPAT